MAQQIIFRNGVSTLWASINPTLAAAEMGVEIDTYRFKIGDGLTPWNLLPYGGLVGPAGANGAPGATGPQGPAGATFGVFDGGDSASNYGGITEVDGGNSLGV